MVAKPKQNSFRTRYSLIVDESDLRESPLQIFRQCLWIAGVDKKDLFSFGNKNKDWHHVSLFCAVHVSY